MKELGLPVGTPPTPLPESFKGPTQKLGLCCLLMEERQPREPPAGTPPAWLPQGIEEVKILPAQTSYSPRVLSFISHSL